MRFQYQIEDPKSIWEKITIQGSIITVYYRILRGKAGQTEDEALFSVAPSHYQYIFDKQPKHDGLHADIFESLFLHRHVDCQELVSTRVLADVISVFRKLEPICAEKGQYTPGQYVFLQPKDEQVLISAFAEYLRQNNIIIADKTQASSAGSYTPQYAILKHTTPNKEEVARQCLAKRLGEAFMNKHGKSLAMHVVGDEYIFTITLSLGEPGKKWFLEKTPNCEFIAAKEGGITVKMTVQVLSADSVPKRAGLATI